MEKIVEAYNEYLSRGIMPEIGKDGKYFIPGATSEGIVIEIYKTPMGEIVNAFPSERLNVWG